MEYHKCYGVSNLYGRRVTRVFYLQNCRKAYYFDCHRQFLPLDHLYRRNKKAFTKNRVERRVARPRLTGEQICNWVQEFSPAVEVSLSLQTAKVVSISGQKKKHLLGARVLSRHLIRHNLGVMHIEKNVFDDVFNTVMDIKEKTKDNLNARKDLKIICN
ncbi:UNVERIFIED_CONTAM: hypothetical protein Sradi_3786200 [Sesamum radiatum]|uniref:Uncharacterized protein n=1 Tax=Sesamum radiatum TaxID=300843 RepID=A0AAW2PZX5_SESRA